jgi:hypothetical protein
VNFCLVWIRLSACRIRTPSRRRTAAEQVPVTFQGCQVLIGFTSLDHAETAARALEDPGRGFAWRGVRVASGTVLERSAIAVGDKLGLSGASVPKPGGSSEAECAHVLVATRRGAVHPPSRTAERSSLTARRRT